MILEIFYLSMLLGVVSGLLAGLFGLGGGVIIVPALVWLFSYQQFPHEYMMIMAVATSLATIVPTSIAALLAHHSFGTILWGRVYRLTPGILLGAGGGALVADLIDAGALKGLFIGYLFYVGIRMAMQAQAVCSDKRLKANKRLDYIAGLGIGGLSSLLGIGGGTLTVPYLLSRHLPMKNAVAVSSVCGLPIALSATFVYVFLGENQLYLPVWSFGYVYLPAFSGIAVCSVLTAPLGAAMANKLPAKKLKRYFSLVILLIAIKMITI